MKTECCGNPLRGCQDCPPQKKLTFEEWYKTLPKYYYTTGEFDAMKLAWQAAQENV